ncbi:MAG TPA: hypothetical protein VGD37_42750 [Kofleriaceae bacterium]
MLMVLCAAAAAAASGCADTDKSSDDSLIKAVEAAGGVYVGEVPQASFPPKGGISQVNERGLCCWGHCNASNAFENLSISSGCREWVVAVCHNANPPQPFNPNGDAWWGAC